MATKKSDATPAASKKIMDRDSRNLVSAIFGPAAVKDVEGLLDSAEAKMPFLVSLSPAERVETLRVGDTLIEGAIEIIPLLREYGDYIGKAIADADEMERDAALDAALAVIEARLERLLGLVRDARLLARSDLARAALAVYAASRMIPKELGAAAKVEKLRSFFTGRVRK